MSDVISKLDTTEYGYLISSRLGQHKDDRTYDEVISEWAKEKKKTA